MYKDVAMWVGDDCTCTDSFMCSTFGETINELPDFVGAAEALAEATAKKLSLSVWRQEWHSRSGDDRTTWTRVEFARACAQHWMRRCAAFGEWRETMGISYERKMATAPKGRAPHGKSKRNERSGRMRPIKARKVADPSVADPSC